MLLRSILLVSITTVSVVEPWWLLSETTRERFTSHAPSACSMVPGLSSKQRQLCIRNPDAMQFVVDGLRMALDECQSAFREQVWNCSINTRGIGTSPLKLASKESAYVYAIASAGVSHSLARACSKGLIEDCGCGPVPSAVGKNFVWSGCSDNVRYGNGFGRRFIDATEKVHKDARSMMNLHNNRVGRRLLANSMTRQCKCHGVSGSCVTKTCWKVVPRFDEFASMLKDKYELAQQVTAAPHGTALMVRPGSHSESGRTERYLKEVDHKKAVKNELVFLDSSPDYCSDSRGRGPIDVRGRECREETCNEICCGRGWHTVRVVVDEPCQCKFIWCCQVQCETCKKVVDKNYCR